MTEPTVLQEGDILATAIGGKYERFVVRRAPAPQANGVQTCLASAPGYGSLYVYWSPRSSYGQWTGRLNTKTKEVRLDFALRSRATP